MAKIGPIWSHCLKVAGRVARCYIFKPKIPIWEHFGGLWNGKSGPFGIY
jgi:hypothetical protein